MNDTTSRKVPVQLAGELSDQLMGTFKVMASLRDHAPRLVPGADPVAYPVLFRLTGGPSRVSDLADCLHADVSTVSRHCTALAKVGLVEKVPDPVDRRAQVVTLTPTGEDLVHQLHVQRKEWFDTILHDWESADIEAFQGYLARFAKDVERYRDAAHS